MHEETKKKEAATDVAKIEVRHATVPDAASLWSLVRDCEVLDTNSCYAYLLICRDFSATTLVAMDDNQLVGFVSAYIPPQRPDALFVWQIGIRSSARGRGIARLLLNRLLAADACRSVRFLEATITPGNAASRRLFESVAAQHGADLRYEAGFSERDFGAALHDAEELVRIQLK